MSDFNKKLRIATRGSELALWQAKFVQAQLASHQIDSELVIVQTKGDLIQHLSFDKIEGKGFFTKEIEETLLRGEAELAVHSMKDLSTQAVDGLVLAAVSYREDPSDCLLIRKDKAEDDQIFKLCQQAIVGTSSARRKAQMLHFRPDVQLKDLRGNVPTRIRKLREGEYDAILLASAGISRLELDISDLVQIKLSPKEFVPAPAQGVLALQCLESDIETRRILKLLHHSDVSSRTNVERKALQLLEGGCQMPIGVYCERDTLGNYHVWAAFAESWQSPVKKVRLSSNTSFELPENIVKELKK